MLPLQIQCNFIWGDTIITVHNFAPSPPSPPHKKVCSFTLNLNYTVLLFSKLKEPFFSLFNLYFIVLINIPRS